MEIFTKITSHQLYHYWCFAKPYCTAKWICSHSCETAKAASDKACACNHSGKNNTNGPVHFNLHCCQSSPDEVVALGPLKHVGYFLDCPPAFYWNKVLSGPFSRGVMRKFQFQFFLKYTTIHYGQA